MNVSKETSFSEDGRKLLIVQHDDLVDFETIVTAMTEHFDGQIRKRIDAGPLGQRSALVECSGKLVDVVWDEAWGISVRMEGQDDPRVLQAIANFLDQYLPKRRAMKA